MQAKFMMERKRKNTTSFLIPLSIRCPPYILLCPPLQDPHTFHHHPTKRPVEQQWEDGTC